MGLFSRKAEKKEPVCVYLIMDRNARMLARGKRKAASDSELLTISLIDGDAENVRNAEIVQTVPQDKSLPPQMCRVVNFSADSVSLMPMRELNSEVRRNFRVPVAFDSFVYPAGGGRAKIESIDLSCGGVAFRTSLPMSVGNIFEVVIPITREGPLLLKAELLRVHLEASGENFYACKFLNMIDEEESMLREAVFAIQLSTVKSRNN